MPPKKLKLNEVEAPVAKCTTQLRSTRRSTRNAAQLPSSIQITKRKESQEVGNSCMRRRDEEAGKERRQMGASVVNNILALADTLGVKEGSHVDADQLLFLDTVRVMAISPEIAMVPAKDVYEKILSGIQQTKSLQVIMASFRLLHDLDMRHPQVTVTSSGVGSGKAFDLVDNKEHVWSPFDRNLQQAEEEASSTKPVKVPVDLYMLLDCIADNIKGGPKSKHVKMKVKHKTSKNEDPLTRLVQFFMLQWLVSLLNSDLQARQRVCQGNPEKLHFVNESIIRRLLLGPYNGNIKQLLSILLDIVASLDTDETQEESEDDEMETEESDEDSKPSVVDDQTTSTESDSTISSPTFFVAETEIVHLATTLLSMILELDNFRDTNDSKMGVVRRSNSFGSLMESLMDALQYHKNYLSPLLQALDNPHLKMRIILTFFVNHAPQAMKEDLQLIQSPKGLFDCIANVKKHNNVCIKFSPIELQILLVNAFQVHLELHRAEHNEDDDSLKKITILDVCKSFQAALHNMSGKSRGKFVLQKSTQSVLVIVDLLSKS